MIKIRANHVRGYHEDVRRLAFPCALEGAGAGPGLGVISLFLPAFLLAFGEGASS
jgi:hypothetical protein